MSDSAAVAAERPWPSRAYAWLVVAVLVAAALVAFIDRQVVAIVVDPMKADLGVNDAQIGWLYGVFAVFYAVAALPIAWLADRRSRKLIIAAGIFFWSLMTMACGVSRTFWQVLLARIGVGIGEATLTPATTSLVGDLFPREQVPLALSIVQSGPIMGSGIAFIIGGYVLGLVQDAPPLILPGFGELSAWQQTFLYLGAPGLLLAFLFALLREPPRRACVSASHGGWGDLIAFYRRNARTLLLHHFGFLSLVLAGYAFVFWTVSWFVRVHGQEAAEASWIFGWIFLLAGPTGPVLVALLARSMSARGHADANILAAMVGGLAAGLLVVAVQFAPNASLAYVLYVPALIAVNSPYGLAAGALPVITPPHLRARVASVYLFVSALGMMLGPPITGLFNEVVFPEPQGVRYSMMTVSVIFGCIGLVILQLARKPYAASLARVSSAPGGAAD